MDKWEDSQLERMQDVGNTRAKMNYERRVPACYRRPIESDPQWVFVFVVLFDINIKLNIFII